MFQRFSFVLSFLPIFVDFLSAFPVFIIITPSEFFSPVLRVVFHWRLSDCKPSQVSRTLLSIPSDLDNAMVSIPPLISSSSNLFSKSLETVSCAPTTISVIFTLMFHCFFSSQARSKYSSLLLFSFIFTLRSAGRAKSTKWQVLFFLLINTSSDFLARMRLLLLLLLLWELFTPALADDFPLELCDSKSPQVSRTLLSILADLNNVVVWIVSTCPLISKSSSPFIYPFRGIPSAPITIGLTITFMFHSFFVL